MIKEKIKKYRIIGKTILDNIKYIMIFLFIVVFIIVMYIYNSNKLEKSINITGEEKLKGLDINTYDVMALSLDLDDDELITVPTSYNMDDDNTISISYYLNEETNFYKKEIKNRSNEEGVTFSNIDYEVITRSDLRQILEDNKEGILTYIWASENKKCYNILISYE